MISRRNDYNYLLDNLRDLEKRYVRNIKEKEYNIIDDEVYRERIIASIKFGMLYREAYYATKYIAHTKTIENQAVLNNLVYQDYCTFNSFINNCVNECKMYNDIGGNEFSYIPYQDLAGYMLDNSDNKKIVVDYLKFEFENELSFEKGKRKSKKID